MKAKMFELTNIQYKNSNIYVCLLKPHQNEADFVYTIILYYITYTTIKIIHYT